MLKQDWKRVGDYIKNSIFAGVYDNLVKKSSNYFQNVAEKAAKEDCENEK